MSTLLTSVTQEQFVQYIRPALSVAKRGYECSSPLYKAGCYLNADTAFDTKAAR